MCLKLPSLFDAGCVSKEGTTDAQQSKKSTSTTKDILNSTLVTKHGGRWAPASCVARQKLAIIIPFRDRDQHLLTMLSVLHPMLQKQLIDYTIFVVEQVWELHEARF